VGRGAARFDFKKLEHLNGIYIREAEDARLAAIVAPQIESTLGRALSSDDSAKLIAAMPALKLRAKSTLALAEGALFLFESRPLHYSDAARALLDDAGLDLLAKVINVLQECPQWAEAALESAVKGVAEEVAVGLGKVAQPLRAALTGRTTSPGIYDVLLLLGREEAMARLNDALGLRG
jgi:glutamyl-tRNA synthetase